MASSRTSSSSTSRFTSSRLVVVPPIEVFGGACGAGGIDERLSVVYKIVSSSSISSSST